MSYVSTNIKALRKKKKLTQSAFAEKIGVNRSVVGAYEEGRADPRVKTLLTIAHFFKITVDDLLKKDLSTKRSSGQFSMGDLRVLPIMVDTSNEELIPLVPQKASAGYLNGFADSEFLENLPLFQMPFDQLPRGKTHRIFQISGDSMLPLPHGAFVVGTYVEDSRNLKEGSTYIFVTKEDGVVYKRLKKLDMTNHEVTLSSDNPKYDSYQTPLTDLLEIWKALAYVSFDLPEEGDFKPSLDALAKSVKEMKRTLENIKG